MTSADENPSHAEPVLGSVRSRTSVARVRSWQRDDEARLHTLLDGSADRLWIEQFHCQHGPDRPLPTKVRSSNSAARGFIASAGGRAYQRCEGVVINPHDPDVKRWVDENRTDACASMIDESVRSLSSAFARQYAWVHRLWSPVGDTARLAEIADSEVATIDRTVSAGTRVAGRLAATAFAFPTAEGGFEVVAETVDEHEPSGTQLLAQAVAFLLAAASELHGTLVEFDGHVTDPHLHPILASLPHYRTNPVELVELR